jgi:protein-tyrosine phosphatase
VISFFKKEKKTSVAPLIVDIHSHLLPNLDDGAESMEQSLEMLVEFQNLGYKKLITTPHIMTDFFPNTAQNIRKRFEELNTYLKGKNINIKIGIAAEYYLDEGLIEKLQNKEEILTFGKNYLLFETPFLNEPAFLKEFIFLAQSRGYIPVMAHPERYQYLHKNHTFIHELKERGALFQININSLSGYYSKESKDICKFLIKEKLISFLGSDCHNMKHINFLKESIDKKYFKKALDLELLNNTL